LQRVRLASGDVLLFGGPARMAYHGAQAVSLCGRASGGCGGEDEMDEVWWISVGNRRAVIVTPSCCAMGCELSGIARVFPNTAPAALQMRAGRLNITLREF
jgi:hypothetical protein